jgi:putative MATE family efflux protein
MVLALIAIGSVGIVDAYFLGGIGTDALASLGFSVPVYFFLNALWVGFGIGVTSSIARALGANEPELARRFGSDAFVLAVGLCAIEVTVGTLAIDAYSAWVGVPVAIRPLVAQYLVVMILGMPIWAFVLVASAIIRAYGNMRASALVLVTSAVANLALAPVLIYGFGAVPALDVQGAALAVVAGYVCAAAPALYLLGRHRMVGLRYSGPVEFMERARRVLGVGGPSMMGQIVRPLHIIALTWIVSGFGGVAVAAFAVNLSIQRIIANAFLAFSSAVTPFVGQNSAAGLQHRAADAIARTRRWVWGIAGAVWVVLAVGADSIARLLVDDLSTRAALETILWSAPLGFGGSGSILIATSGLNAIGKGATALRLIVLETIVISLPFALLGREIFGLVGMFLGVAIAEGLVDFYSTWILREHGLTVQVVDVARIPVEEAEETAAEKSNS